MSGRIDRQGKRFLLSNDGMSYAFEVTETDVPVNLYWGIPLDSIGDLPSPELRQSNRHTPTDLTGRKFRELPVFGGKFFDESALKISYSDGIRGSEFRFSGEEREGDSLILTFRESRHAVVLRLRYTLYDRILERSWTLSNESTEPVELENFASAAWHLPSDVTEWRATHLGGHAHMEAVPSRQNLTPGKFVIESRTGLSGPFHVPFFALDDGMATELAGRVFFGVVLWSGNWKITFDRDWFGHTAVLGGINEFDSRIVLKPGETFEAPSSAAGVTMEGFSGMSRILHRWQDDVLLPPGVAHKQLPMLTNTWGSLNVNVSEETVIRTAENAAKIGSELFVIDDGWQSALGDWYPDRKKFPNGLRPVVERVAELGMKFGLWIEPESFELKSELYREHPDWAMCYPGCKPESRYRGDVDRTSVMLNLAKREVAEYLYRSIHRLVKETGISYLKLDMNCFFSSPGGAERIWIDYARNLDWIFQTLSADFPELLMENCASGAARASLQMTRSFGRMNRSDNQDALDMVKLHEGFTYVNLPRMAGGACHISDSMVYVNNRVTPLKFQAYCGMLGSLACGKNLMLCPEQELEEIRSYVELYKKLRPVVHSGSLYRLASAFEHPYAIYEYVSPDRSEAVIFVLGTFIQFTQKIPPFLVPGLDPEAVYDVECYGNVVHGDGYTASVAEYRPLSGRGAAQVGLQVELTGDYDCRILHLRRRNR